MRIRMDAAKPGQSQAKIIEELQNKLFQLNEQSQSIQAAADSEHRPLTPEEEGQLKQIFEAFDMTKAEIARRERIEQQNQELEIPMARRVRPDDMPTSDRVVAPNQSPEQHHPVTGGLSAARKSSTWGFRSFGEFAMSVKRAIRGERDPRLTIGNGPTTYGSEGVGEDGGFAVPPDFRQEIMVKVMAPESLLGRTDQQISSSNQITIPKDETTAWQTSGGVQAYWENEGDQLKASKVELQSTTIRLNKLTCLVPVTDELLEDVNALSSYLRRKAPEKIDYKISDAIVNGTGAGQPQGLMKAGGKITVAAKSGQGAGTVVFENVQSMWARMYAPCRSKAVWLINQDVEPQLNQMVLQSGTATTQLGFPVYLPAGGLSGSPYATLMGRPVIPHEACQALGTEGDIILADLSTYLAIVKAGGLRQDVSIHLWFDYDMTAFRFIIRVGGQPWWTSAIKRAHGTNTLGCFTTLNSTRT